MRTLTISDITSRCVHTHAHMHPCTPIHTHAHPCTPMCRQPNMQADNQTKSPTEMCVCVCGQCAFQTHALSHPPHTRSTHTRSTHALHTHALHTWAHKPRCTCVLSDIEGVLCCDNRTPILSQRDVNTQNQTERQGKHNRKMGHAWLACLKFKKEGKEERKKGEGERKKRKREHDCVCVVCVDFEEIGGLCAQISRKNGHSQVRRRNRFIENDHF